MKASFVVCAAVVGCGAPSQAPGTETIAFTRAPGDTIVVAATLNEVDPLMLVLHTATTDISLTETATATATSLRFASTVDVGSWGGGGKSRVSTGNRLRIGERQRSDITVWEDKQSPEGSDGKIGLDFFAGRIVEIDYARNKLIIHGRLPANKLATFERLPLEARDGKLFVSASCVVGDKRFTTQFSCTPGMQVGCYSRMRSWRAAASIAYSMFASVRR